MNRNTLLAKCIIPVATLIVAIGISTIQPFKPMMTNAWSTPETETFDNLTIIDTKQENLSYLYVEADDSVSTLAPRSIIGFNIPASEEVVSINRLTIQINYSTYKWWDLFKINPIDNEETFIISSNKTYVLYLTFGAQFRVPYPNIPAIGIPSELPENVLGTKVPISQMEEERTNFLSKDFYVIMPVDHTYQQIFISIDAYTTTGHISDGTDDGSFYEDSEGKYITFSTESPWIHFTSNTVITKINIVVAGEGILNLIFGNYSYVTNKLDPKTIVSNLTFESTISINVNIAVPAMYEGYITPLNESEVVGAVKLYYEASSPIVSYNLRDEDGNLPQPVGEPDTDGWGWGWFRDKFGSVLNDFFTVIKILLILIIGLIAVNYVILPIIRLKNTSNRKYSR